MEKNILKNILIEVKFKHQFPKWFNIIKNKSLIEKLFNEHVLYYSDGTNIAIYWNPNEPDRLWKDHEMCVDETALKNIYNIELL